jgi:O-antigen/teichoic acid export membrane protein
MLKELKQLTGETIIYGLSSVASGLISFFLIPVYTRLFSPADYGVVSLINISFVFLQTLVVFGLDNSVMFWYYHKEDEKERRKTFGSWIFFLFIVTFLTSLLIIIFSQTISGLILGDVKYSDLFIIAGSNLLFFVFQRVIVNWLRTQRKALAVVIFTLTISLINVGLTIYLVAYLKIGIRGVFISQLSSSLVGFVIMVIAMRKLISPRYFDFIRTKEMIIYSLPLVPAAILLWVLNSSGGFFIEHYSKTLSEVGIFQIGVSISAVMGLINSAFLQAWSPFAMSVSKKENAGSIYSRVFLLYLYLSTLAALTISFFSYEFLKLFAKPDYYEAASVISLFVFNSILLGAAQIVSIGSALAKDNKPFGIAVFLGAICTLILFHFLIPAFGKEGAVVACMAGNALLTFYVFYKSQKLYRIPYDVPKILLISFISLTGCIISIQLLKENSTWYLFIKIAFIFLYGLLLCFLNFTEIRLLVKKIRSWNT